MTKLSTILSYFNTNWRLFSAAEHKNKQEKWSLSWLRSYDSRLANRSNHCKYNNYESTIIKKKFLKKEIIEVSF
jgi:hypothetical protein